LTADKYFPKINSNELYNIKIVPANEMVSLKIDTINIRDPDEKVPQSNDQQANKEEPKVQL